MWIIGIIVLFAITKTTPIRQTTTSQELIASVEKLERQIKSGLKSKIIAIPDKEFDEYSYEDMISVITPVTEEDKMLKYITKAQDYVFLKKIKTTKGRVNLGQPFEYDKFIDFARNGKKRKDEHKRKKHARSNRFRPIVKEAEETFYRRFDYDGYKKFKNMKVDWIHCEDMIWPYAAGLKTNITARKFKTVDSYVVDRFFHLMKTDVTNLTGAEVYSLLLQINKLDLKFFKWDERAIKRLLNSLMPGKGIPQTFNNLKKALKSFIDRWRINLDNNLNLILNSSKMFRPPCILGNRDNPSTKYSKRITLTPPRPRTTKSCSTTTISQPVPKPSKSSHRGHKRRKKKIAL